MLIVIRKVVAARHAPPLAAGSEALVGVPAIALTPLAPRGQILVASERWQAIADDGPHEAGDELVVTSVEGLRLHVAPRASASPPGYDAPRSKVLPTPVRGAR
jgi:membrane-bound ClpP family serine protease